MLLKLDSSGRGGTLYCANVGDALAVLCRNCKGIRLSRDFKPFDDDEYDRIVAADGWVSLRDGGRVCDVSAPPPAGRGDADHPLQCD